MSGFDWDRVEVPDDKFVKFKPDVHVEGVVTEIGEHSFDGKQYFPQVTLDTADGERVVTASNIGLLKLFKAHRPQVGDTLKITCTGVTPLAGGRTMNNFILDVASPADHVALEPEAGDDPDDPAAEPF